MTEQTAAPTRPLGTQRDDDLLSLDMTAVNHRRALVSLAYTLRSAVLVGNPAPVVMDIWRRMRHPQPGDFVVEASIVPRLMMRPWPLGEADLDTLIKGNGILIEHRQEPYGGPDPDDIGHEDVWYVQYGPAPVDVCRWENAMFFAIPINGELWSRQ